MDLLANRLAATYNTVAGLDIRHVKADAARASSA